MSSEQIVLHADNQELRKRVVAILVDEDRKGKALAPQIDPMPEVIENRWIWASTWFDKVDVSDANIQGTVRIIWPIPVPPEE